MPHDADVVIFDHDMSPNQLRDLEKIIDRKILDRSELILDIFATRARTHEAQLQVALAQLEYTYPRLRHMWSHLERIAGGAGAGVGARGPGEMQLEIDRRLVREKVADLKHRIADVQARKTREVARTQAPAFHDLARRLHQRRQIHALQHPHRRRHVRRGQALRHAGHQNAPLAPRRGEPEIAESNGDGGGAHSALISDTVGFVRDLPHHLVASFKATLEEATHADMLLLVLDVSHPHAQMQLKTVVQGAHGHRLRAYSDAAGPQQN